MGVHWRRQDGWHPEIMIDPRVCQVRRGDSYVGINRNECAVLELLWLIYPAPALRNEMLDRCPHLSMTADVGRIVQGLNDALRHLGMRVNRDGKFYTLSLSLRDDRSLKKVIKAGINAGKTMYEIEEDVRGVA